MPVILRPRMAAVASKRWGPTIGYDRTYRYPNNLSIPIMDWSTDLLIAVPKPHDVVNAPPEYKDLRSLYAKTKWNQRRWCHENGIPTPLDVQNATTYVKRPLSHRSGRGFEIFEREPMTTEEIIEHNTGADHYISPLFERTHEYRITTHKGRVVTTILKRNVTDLPQDQPWNGSNGTTFVTVRNPENNRLRHTDVYDRINHPVLNTAHLLGIDVLYNRNTNTYAVCEINFAPTQDIQRNIEELKNVINAAA